MDQSADRGRRFHCIGQPSVEWELCRFRRRRDQKAEGNESKQVRRNCPCVFKQGRDLICPERGIGYQRASQQPHPTDLRNDQRFDTARHCFWVIVIKGNQSIRTKRRNLPEEEHEEQTSTENESRHGADEEKNESVIAA